MSKKKLIFKIVFITVLVIVLGVGAYAYSIYDNVKEVVDTEMHQPIASIDDNTVAKVEKKVKKGLEPINILLMGVDENEYDRGRADTLIVLSLNPNIDSIQLISIPRDTRTEIGDTGTFTKINAAYFYGGADLTVATVEKMLDFDFDYYVKLNFNALTDLVDALGGITVDNPVEWYDSGYYKKGYHYAEGEIELDGEQTLGFVRMRKQDPDGDFGRNKRQRIAIQAIIDKGASLGSVTKINDILEVLGNNMATNLTFDEMKDLFLNYKSTRHNIETYQVQGYGGFVDDLWYYIVPNEERQNIKTVIEEFNQREEIEEASS
ncbi:LCP family glycopolymer transferase [Salirhabdus salicampi]|uniref:LCP family glycopolymer transferase n=1 Tax=Salirhabdus salicampi TaxID=476102 RepID=UPI0020C522C8|nr:LCP family protein [Salirhabdus salicampi]MCP8617584.1 LCP family protein [Salirhabdus salicampi]